MPRVPEHPVIRRVSNQSTLAVRQQESAVLNDSVIVIKMLSAAVCGTDLAILSGNRPGQAEVIGHEGVGTVLHAPEDSGMSIGSKVIFNPVNQKHPEEVIGHSRDGIFRGLFCIDAADAAEGSFLVACPRECSLEDAELAIAEPIASVLYSLELLREQCGAASLLIRGSGTVGILAAKLWSTMVGGFAIVVSKSEAHAQWLREATRWPANVRICSRSQLASTIRECSSGPPLKAAILCCSRESTPEGLCTLMDALPEGATIDLMAGFPAEYRETRLGGVSLDRIRWDNSCGLNGAPPTTVVDSLSGKTLHLMGHRGTAERHILQAIELMSRKVISKDDIPHHLLTLEQLPGAVDKMLSTKTRPDAKWVKAIVDFSRKDSGQTNGDC
jgi:threonine dehydrogenase-like Zn-dependent dehydrogenase